MPKGKKVCGPYTWSDSAGAFTLEFTDEDLEMVPRHGKVDEEIEDLVEEEHISDQLEEVHPADIASELKDYGAWSDEELADHDQNLRRLLWIAVGAVQDEPEVYASEPESEGDEDGEEEDG